MYLVFKYETLLKILPASSQWNVLRILSIISSKSNIAITDLRLSEPADSGRFSGRSLVQLEWVVKLQFSLRGWHAQPKPDMWR